MLPLKIAIRFLKSGRGQTLLIIIGIGVAVSAQIFIGLLISSLQQTLIDSTIGHSPKITITSDNSDVYIKNWQSKLETMRETGLVNNVAVSASGNAFINKNSKTEPVLIRGLDPVAFENIYDVNSFIYQGRWTASRNQVLMGRELRDDLGYNLGDNLVVTTPSGTSGNYKITGFYDLGTASVNKTWIISDVSTAQGLLGYGKFVTSIEMSVNDPFQADIIAKQIELKLNDNNIKIANWQSQNQSLLNGLQGQSISSFMIQIFIIVSVVIAIASILAITVFQKSRQLGILKAMGIKDRAASMIFIYEGFILGLLGSVIGVLLGLGFLYGFGVATTKPGQPPLINVIIDYKFVALSWGISIAAAILAALIPARRTLRLNPIDVIREG